MSWVSFWVTLTLIVSACNPSLPEYVEARSHWSRSGENYRDLELTAKMHATLLTADFRQAYAAEYARLFSLTPAQTNAFEAAQMKEDTEHHAVILILTTQEASWNNLNPPAGIWRIRLANRRGDSVDLQDARQHDHHNPTWHALYPALTPHYRIWELRFPKRTDPGELLGSKGHHLDLFVAGAGGQFKFSWKL